MIFDAWVQTLLQVRVFRAGIAGVRSTLLMVEYKVYDEKISKASNAGKVSEIFDILSQRLSAIDELKYVKIYKGRILASNSLSEDGKKKPITEIGLYDVVGVELLVDDYIKVIQFFSLTSSIKGCGEKIVSAVLEAAPDDWEVVVVMDWSNGFWQVMSKRYPKLVVC